MLDINYIRDNTDLIKQACLDKQLDAKVVDLLLKADEARRSQQLVVDNLRQQSNTLVDQIKTQVAQGQKPQADQIAQGKQIKDQLKIEEPKLTQIQTNYQKLMLEMPNPPAQGVPVGKDESGNQVIKTVGEPTKFDFTPQAHQTLMENLGWLDVKRAVKIGGFRSYFLKGDGLLLEQALLKYGLKLLIKAGFTPMSVPVLVGEPALEGTGFFPWGKADHYQTQDGQFLTGTAEVALTAYCTGETLSYKDLPIKMCGLSPCFRREVGTYGKDTQGIIRVHQFNKVEQVVYTIADEAETKKWHGQMVELAESMLVDLGLPYQVVNMCTGDMGAGQRLKFDIETWFPAQNKYRETHSASYFNDFQARRLNIKYRDQDGTTKYVYTINNTMVATPRLLVACAENWQTKDGQIKIPGIIQELM
ncbi:serine--tRNA ligase [Patescibacteria group bacterium]|nr:serine--tRNA ligase [Patescibacteria group bacterium]